MNWTGIGRPRNWQQLSARFIAAAAVFFLYFTLPGGQGILIDTESAVAAMFASILTDRPSIQEF